MLMAFLNNGCLCFCFIKGVYTGVDVIREHGGLEGEVDHSTPCDTCLIDTEPPLDDILHDESEDTKSEDEEQDKGTEWTGTGFTRQVPDYKQHEADKEDQAEGEPEFRDHLFIEQRFIHVG